MDVYFSGLGIEIGQNKRGLVKSPFIAKQFLSHHALFEFVDLGESHWTSQSNMLFQKNSDLKYLNSSEGFISKAIKKNIALYEGLGKRQLLNWGGDHSLGIATVSSFKSAFPNGKILWIDAHADLNIPTSSLTGHLHGMPVGLLLNLENVAQHFMPDVPLQNIQPQDIFYLGLRDLDPFESEIIKELNIPHISFRDYQTLGHETSMNLINKWHQGLPMHLSFDIDSVNPTFAPCTGVPVAEGFTPNDLIRIGSELKSKAQVVSVDVAEINPDIGSASSVYITYLTSIQFLNALIKGAKYEKCSYPNSKYSQNSLAQIASFSSPTWHFY